MKYLFDATALASMTLMGCSTMQSTMNVLVADGEQR